MSDTWTVAKQNLSVGTLVDDKYRVARIDEKVRGAKRDAVVLTRLSSGKEVAISRKMIEHTQERLESGEKLLKQKNQKKGGISDTIAVEAGVIAALGTSVSYDAAARVFVPARAASKAAG